MHSRAPDSVNQALQSVHVFVTAIDTLRPVLSALPPAVTRRVLQVSHWQRFSQAGVQGVVGTPDIKLLE